MERPGSGTLLIRHLAGEVIYTALKRVNAGIFKAVSCMQSCVYPFRTFCILWTLMGAGGLGTYMAFQPRKCEKQLLCDFLLTFGFNALQW